MDEPPAGPTPYRVSYSEWVRQELRRILLLANKHGRLAEFLNAVKEIPPLVVRYTLDEKERLVLVSVPITPMNPSDLQ